MNKTSVFVLGGGGHAKVLLDCLSLNHHFDILGMVETNPELHGKLILGYSILGDEDQILNYSGEFYLANGIGSTGNTDLRKKIFNKFKMKNFIFVNAIHPSANIGQDVLLKEGVQVFAGSVIQAGSEIGNNVIINTHASIDHDCQIGDHVHIAPGAICCGGVKIGEGTHVGTGAVILQGITIGENCLIAAGAVVTQNVCSIARVAGVPAKLME